MVDWYVYQEVVGGASEFLVDQYIVFLISVHCSYELLTCHKYFTLVRLLVVYHTTIKVERKSCKYMFYMFLNPWFYSSVNGHHNN